MRKEWMEPVIEVQEFVANEYVAAAHAVQALTKKLPILLKTAHRHQILL